MSQLLLKIKDGIQYGIGIAIGMAIVNVTVGLLFTLLNFIIAAGAIKNGVVLN